MLTGDKKRAYDLAWRNKRRQDWIDSKGGKCNICGSTKNLEVDHIDRATKEFHPRELWSRNQEIRDKELAKCQVLCADCHKKKSDAELTIQHPHGTYARYKSNTSPCRCELCKNSVAPFWREYRARKKAK